MILLVIRHGESEAELIDVHEGRADFALTDRGNRQAIAMAEFVRDNYSISKIYASTLKRARQTAQYLGDATGISISFEEELMEFNNGLLAGVPRAVAKEKYPIVENLPIDQAVYGQESKVEFRLRADHILERIISGTKEDETVAIVTHGGMINQLYRSLLGLAIDCDLFFGTGDTGIHVWRVENESKLIMKANMTEHTRGI